MDSANYDTLIIFCKTILPQVEIHEIYLREREANCCQGFPVFWMMSIHNLLYKLCNYTIQSLSETVSLIGMYLTRRIPIVVINGCI